MSSRSVLIYNDGCTTCHLLARAVWRAAPRSVLVLPVGDPLAVVVREVAGCGRFDQPELIFRSPGGRFEVATGPRLAARFLREVGIRRCARVFDHFAREWLRRRRRARAVPA